MTQPTASGAPPVHKPRIEVIRVGEEHAEALAEFFRAVWSPESTANAIRANRAHAAAVNPVQPGADVPAFAFLSDGRVLGYIGTIPARLWNGVDEHEAHWLQGFMVLPEFRGGPVGHAVLKEAIRQLGLIAAMVVALPPRRLFTALGFHDAGPIRNYLTLIRPTRVLRALDLDALGVGGIPGWARRVLGLAQRTGLATVAGAVAVAAMGLWRATRGRPGRLADTREMPSLADLDALWREARVGLGAAPVRDGAYMHWRYGGSEIGTYVVVAVRDGHALVGMAAIRRPREEGDPRLRGIRVATLADVLYVPGRRDAALATLAAAERVASSLGADALLCTASHPAITTLLPRRAYVRFSGNVHFLIRDPRDAHRMSRELTDWWLTRGDASSDEVF